MSAVDHLVSRCQSKATNFNCVTKSFLVILRIMSRPLNMMDRASKSDTFYEGKHARSLFKAEILLAAVTHFGTYLRMIKIHVCDVIIYFALKFEQRLSCQRQYDIIITVKSCIINAICNYICFQGSNLRLHSVGAEPNSMLTNDHSNHLYIRKEVYCKCCK